MAGKVERKGGKDPKTKKWEDFFESLSPSPQISTNREENYEESGSDRPFRDDVNMKDMCSQNPFLANFIGNLQLQKLEHDKEKEYDLSEEKRKIDDSLVSLIENALRSLLKDSKQHCDSPKKGIERLGRSHWNLESSLIEESCDNLQKAFNEYNKYDSQKPDMKMPGSAWNLDMLAKYFSLDVAHYVKSDHDMLTQPDNKKADDNKEIQEILESLGISAEEVIISRTGLHLLQYHVSLSEYSVRMILDSLLRGICRQARIEDAIRLYPDDFEIILRPQHSMKRQGLPTNIFDYVLITSSRLHPQHFVGIIEVKKPDTMDKKAVAQLVIQLMSLLTATEDPDSTCFGVLTDGYRFLFAYANKDGIYFENKWHDDGGPTVLVHEAETWKDLDVIKSKILNLCRIVHDIGDFQLHQESSIFRESEKYISRPRFTMAKAIPFSLTNKPQEQQY